MSEIIIKEVRFFLKIMKFFGNLPLKNLNAENFEQIRFKFFSLETLYSFMVYTFLIILYIFYYTEGLQTVELANLFLMLTIRLCTLSSSLQTVKLLAEISGIDDHFKRLRGKRPVLKSQIKRSVVQGSTLILLFTTSQFWKILLLKGHLALLTYIIHIIPIYLSVIIYYSLCTALINRQIDICSECHLLFNEIGTLTHKGSDSALVLMKIRHSHLMLMNFLRNFNKVFSTMNLISTIQVYFRVISNFLMGHSKELNRAGGTHHKSSYFEILKMLRSYAMHFLLCSFHNQFQSEVSLH